MRTHHISLSVVMLAAGLTAQVSIADANMQFDSGSVSASSQTPVQFDLVSDVLGLDQGFEHWWYYRLAGDTREFSLRDIGGLTEATNGAGNHFDRDFANVDARGVLNASLDYNTYSTGPTSGVVLGRLTVQNISNAPVVVDLFNYTDIDVVGSFGNDQFSGLGNSHFITDPSGVQIEVRGVGADRTDARPYPQLRNLLSDTNQDNLSGSAPQPFAGDYSGAFQWEGISLLPLQVRTFEVIIAVDHPITAVPSLLQFGKANGTAFGIHADDLPLQDLAGPTDLTITMRGALPFAEYRIVTGLAPWDALPFIGGIDLWVDPFQLIGVYAGFTDAGGEGNIVFSIPASPYLTGFSVYHQVFYVDGAAPNGFAFQSPGMLTRIGKK